MRLYLLQHQKPEAKLVTTLQQWLHVGCLALVDNQHPGRLPPHSRALIINKLLETTEEPES